MTDKPRPFVFVRKQRVWDGTPAWRWWCERCPKVHGRFRGGWYRLWRPRWARPVPEGSRYDQCRTRALRHLAQEHPADNWDSEETMP